MDVFPNVNSRLILDFFNIDEQNYVSKNWRSIDNVCEFSAKHGYLKLLQWAKSQGCPFFFKRYKLFYEINHTSIKLFNCYFTQNITFIQKDLVYK